MKRSSVISGAMIVAAGVAASTDRVQGEPTDAEQASIKVTSEGLGVDAVKLDDDVVRLGGASRSADHFGAHNDTGGFRTDGDEFYLAQTIYGGDPDSQLIQRNRLPSVQPNVPVTNPLQIHRNNLQGNFQLRSRALGATVAGTEALVVVNPEDEQPVTVLFNKDTSKYYDPESGAEMEPPEWMRQQVER